MMVLIAIAASCAFGMIMATFIVVVFSRPIAAASVAEPSAAPVRFYSEAQSREILTQFGQEIVNSAAGGYQANAPVPTDFLVWYFALHGQDNIAVEMFGAYAESCKSFAKNILANTSAEVAPEPATRAESGTN